jgi:hypothetical protein
VVGSCFNGCFRSSHDVIDKALVALGCMEHRGACSADQVRLCCKTTTSLGAVVLTYNRPSDQDSGDGAGIMTSVPWELLSDLVKPQDRARTGVAMVFLPQDPEQAATAAGIIEGAWDHEARLARPHTTTRLTWRGRGPRGQRRRGSRGWRWWAGVRCRPGRRRWAAWRARPCQPSASSSCARGACRAMTSSGSSTYTAGQGTAPGGERLIGAAGGGG